MIERSSAVQYSLAYVRARLAREADISKVTAPLCERLATLVGTHGCQVLLERSVAVARGAHPVLREVETGPDGALFGLSDAAASEDALSAIVASLIELLVALLSEKLTMELLNEALQDASAPAQWSLRRG